MFIIEVLKVIFFGIVEGVTEWLPISSTGHMILVEEFIHLNVSYKFFEMFLVVIQLGAILAVVVLNFSRLNPCSKRGLKRKKIISLWQKVFVASIPAGVIGLLLNDYMEKNFMNALVVVAMLILYGVAFIWVEHYNETRSAKIYDIDKMDYKTSLIIGAFQVLSLIPGTSRSGATILGGILFGASRTVATEFTFFLAIPIMFGASFLKLVKFGFDYTLQEFIFLIMGVIVAFVVSVISIKFLLRYIQKNDFKIFGWYRIALGLCMLIYFYFLK